MQLCGDPPPVITAAPVGPRMLLDHTPLLLSLPRNHVHGISYQELLSQLGQHLQDLGSVLVAHSSEKNVSLESAITASNTCCSTGCVPPGSSDIPKAAKVQGNFSTFATRTFEPKVLEAMQRRVQSHLQNVKEQEQNERLWELTGGAKNLPPPLSPWLRDPALNGHEKYASDNCQEKGNHSNRILHTPPPVDAVDVLPKHEDNASKSRGTKRTTGAARQTRFMFTDGQRDDGAAERFASIIGLDSSGESDIDRLARASRSSRVRMSRSSRAPELERRSQNTKSSKEPRDQASAKSSVGSSGSTGSSESHQKSLAMLRSVARQASFSFSKSSSEKKKLLIGNGRQQRQDQKKQRQTAVMEEVVHQTTDVHGKEKEPLPLQDSLVALVILLNALIMGISADMPWPVGWDIVEYMFTAFFVSEMVYKMRNSGILNYFIGDDWAWNIFDFLVVIIALVDISIGVVLKVASARDSVDLSKFTAVKMARLGRLCRLVRLLRFKMFKELKTMVQGVFAGLRVLIWAIILFFVFIFGLAMIIRNMYIDEEYAYMKDSFGTTPWAMFTLFRCFTDGCSAHDGTPLIVHFYERYGAYFIILYMLVFLFVTIGLFNLIMAIFVDNVAESSKTMKKLQREMNHDQMDERLRHVVLAVLHKRWKVLKKGRTMGLSGRQMNNLALKGSSDSLLQKTKACCFCRKRQKENEVDVDDDEAFKDEVSMTIDRDLFNVIIEDPMMEEMMEQLDISTSNRFELFDVLDADMSGEMDFEELVVGLMNLRGPTEKSDIVATLLCARSTMQLVQDLIEEHELFANQVANDLSAVLFDLQIIARVMLPEDEDLDVGDERNTAPPIEREN